MSAAILQAFGFEGQQVRTAEIDGGPVIVLSDIAKILGYRDANTASRLLRDHQKGYANVRTPGGEQQMLTVNEKGFNKLVLRSSASNAEAVQDWVSDEVLPSIRRSGAFSIDSPEHLISRALVEASKILTQKDERIAELEPAAQAWDELASADGDYEVADAAKVLSRAGIVTGRQRLFAKLQDLGWIYRGSHGKWSARQTAVDSGYLAEKPQSHYHQKTGEVILDPPQIRVTLRGIARLQVRLTEVK